jgi:hypothetical protein
MSSKTTSENILCKITISIVLEELTINLALNNSLYIWCRILENVYGTIKYETQPAMCVFPINNGRKTK